MVIKETEPADLQDAQLVVPAVAKLQTLGIIACLLLMLLAAYAAGHCKLLFKYFPSKLMLFGLLMLVVASSCDAKGV